MPACIPFSGRAFGRSVLPVARGGRYNGGHGASVPGVGRGNVGAKAATQNRRKGGGKVLPALCNVFGMLLLLGVIALCLPLVLPSVLGYQAFNVISGSMEPAIPIGSVIYVETVDPVDLEKDDIIAFYDDDGAVIAHRVTINRSMLE